MSREDAIRRANEALDFVLEDVDGLLIQVSKNNMAQVFERVLTNNAPEGCVAEIDWDEAPEWTRNHYWFRPSIHSNERVRPVTIYNYAHSAIAEGMSASQCYDEQPPRDSLGFTHFWKALVLTKDAERHYYALTNMPKENWPAPWSEDILYQLNFLREDLRDLYEGGEEGCLPPRE